MAFFEDLGKKVSQTSQAAINKTKIFTETTKLNSQISSENKLIADTYANLGAKYFELFNESPDENLAVFVDDIKAAQQRITDFEDQIAKLKGSSGCPVCGVELAEGAVFCSNCGAKIPEKPPEQEPEQVQGRVCRGCGGPLSETAVFCSACGTKND